MMPSGPSSATKISQSFDRLSRYLGASVTLHADSTAEIVVPDADHVLDAAGRPSELAIMCAIDIATGVASSMASGRPTATLTSDMSIDLLAAPARGELRTIGRVIKAGKRIVLNEAVVTDSTGQAVAFATAGCAPMGEIPTGEHIGGIQLGQTHVLSTDRPATLPIDAEYDTAPIDSADDTSPVASIELSPRTANPFGFLHGAVGAHLLLTGARRGGLRTVRSITVRYLRPTTEGPADVLVDETFSSPEATTLKLSLRDRGTGTLACVAHAVGTAG